MSVTPAGGVRSATIPPAPTKLIASRSEHSPPLAAVAQLPVPVELGSLNTVGVTVVAARAGPAPAKKAAASPAASQ